METISLKGFRTEELALSESKITDKGTSFVLLFDKRLVYSEKQVSVVIDVELAGSTERRSVVYGPLTTFYPKLQKKKVVFEWLIDMRSLPKPTYQCLVVST